MLILRLVCSLLVPCEYPTHTDASGNPQASCLMRKPLQRLRNASLLIPLSVFSSIDQSSDFDSTKIVMDAVCSVASEEILFDDWGLDVVLTASQKGLGTPPGLSILLASKRAIGVWEERKKKGKKEGSYYASWGK